MYCSKEFSLNAIPFINNFWKDYSRNLEKYFRLDVVKENARLFGGGPTDPMDVRWEEEEIRRVNKRKSLNPDLPDEEYEEESSVVNEFVFHDKRVMVDPKTATVPTMIQGKFSVRDAVLETNMNPNPWQYRYDFNNSI